MREKKELSPQNYRFYEGNRPKRSQMFLKKLCRNLKSQSVFLLGIDLLPVMERLRVGTGELIAGSEGATLELEGDLLGRTRTM